MTDGPTEVDRAGAGASGAGPATRSLRSRAWWRVHSFVDDHPVLVFLGPALLVVLVVFVYPVVWMVRESLFATMPGLDRQFDPLFNYERMLASASVRRYAEQTLFYSVGSLALSLGGGTVLALAVNRVRNRWLKAAYTTLLLFAWALPLAVVALTWKWVLVARPYGLLNRLLLDLGLVDAPLALLAEADTALWAVTFVDGWLRAPFAMIVVLAGLQSIPGELYDAARVDGATVFQRFRHVTLPYLRPYLAIVVLINWMFAFRAFSIVYPMTEGGPGTATTTLAVEVYRRGMVDLDFGYGAALSVLLVAVSLVVAAVYVRVVLRRIEA